jgi:hypothetical protein
MSQKHYNLFMDIDFAWFNQQPPYRDFFSDFFNRWTNSESQMPISIEGNPAALQMRTKNIFAFMSEAQGLAKIGFDKYINDKILFPNATPFVDYFSGMPTVSMDIQQYEIKKYGYPRKMIFGGKDFSYYPSERYWYLATINGLWYYADAIDKALIEYEWKTRPDFQEDNGFFQKILRDVATPYLEYLSYAGAVVTVAVAGAAFATAAPGIASQITGGTAPAAGAIAEGGTVGTTLVEAAVSVGAESAAAGAAATAGTTAATSTGFFSSIGAGLSAETVAGIGTIGALAEKEAKKALEKEGEKAISNLISGGGGSSPGQQQPVADAGNGGTVSTAPEISAAGGGFGALGGAIALLLLLL